MKTRYVAAIGALLLSSTTTAFADDTPAYEPPEFINDKPILPDRLDAATARKLSLQDALQVALQQNMSIILRKDQYASTREGIPIGKSRFEPAVIASVLHSDTDSPPLTVQEGQANQVLNNTQDGWNIGIVERAPTGTQFQLDFTNGRSRSSLNTALNPVQYRSTFGFKLTQPLLKGFAFNLDVPYVDVLRAEFASERARQDVLSQFIITVRDTELAYWDAVLALKSYQVRKNALKLGQDQLALTRRQIDAGILPPSDLINAEGTVANRELDLVQSEADIETFADQLRRILNLPRDRWQQPLLPTDTPRYDERTIPFDEALRNALENRPEWKQRRIDVDKAHLDTKIASTERLPQLDAQFTYGLIGQRSSYGGTLGQLTAADAPGWTASLNLTWTPLNIGADAQLRARQATERAARDSQEQQLIDVHVEIRAAIRVLETAVRSVRAAGNARSLAERSLDAEQRKFLNGTSSNFFIAQRQLDVVNAQLAEVAALIRHQKAVTTLRAAEGLLLQDRRVVLDVRPSR